MPLGFRRIKGENLSWITSEKQETCLIRFSNSQNLLQCLAQNGFQQTSGRQKHGNYKKQVIKRGYQEDEQNTTGKVWQEHERRGGTQSKSGPPAKVVKCTVVTMPPSPIPENLFHLSFLVLVPGFLFFGFSTQHLVLFSEITLGETQGSIYGAGDATPVSCM